MLNLLKKPFEMLNYRIERRKYIKYLKIMPQDMETRVGLISWHLQYGHCKEAFEQYKLVKEYSKDCKGSRLEELLKAKEILRSKGYEV